MSREKHLLPCMEEFGSKIQPRVIVHHSYEKLAEIANRTGVNLEEELYNEDFPMLNINYKGHRITLAATRMGIDLSLWCVDKLISCGAKYVMKLGTFVALHEEIQVGDIHVPDRAVVLHGPLNAYLGEGVRYVPADEDLTEMVHAKDSSVKGGTILTYPVWRMTTKDGNYNPYKYKDSCFGLEMECAAVFAAAQFGNVQSAAILTCNRDFATLEGRTKGSWWANRTDPKYHEAYERAIDMALETLAFAGDIQESHFVTNFTKPK